MTVIRNRNFYIVLKPDEILFGTKINGVCAYPAWLGKNRSVMRDVQKLIRKEPPQNIVDFLHIVGHFELQGLHRIHALNNDFFLESC